MRQTDSIVAPPSLARWLVGGSVALLAKVAKVAQVGHALVGDV